MSGTRRMLHWSATALSGVALILVMANAALMIGNARRRTTVNSRQTYINQTIQLSRVNQALVSALATQAVKGQDDALRGVLADSGITIHLNDKKGALDANAKAKKGVVMP